MSGGEGSGSLNYLGFYLAILSFFLILPWSSSITFLKSICTLSLGLFKSVAKSHWVMSVL